MHYLAGKSRENLHMRFIFLRASYCQHNNNINGFRIGRIPINRMSEFYNTDAICQECRRSCNAAPQNHSQAGRIYFLSFPYFLFNRSGLLCAAEYVKIINGLLDNFMPAAAV